MAKLFDPSGLAPPQADYSHGALVAAGEQLLFIAGQVGVRTDGTLGLGFAEQAECAFANVVAVLKSQGMSPADLIRIQLFLTERENLPELLKAKKKVLGDVKPVSTLLVVKSLARAEFLFEVEAVAARAR